MRISLRQRLTKFDLLIANNNKVIPHMAPTFPFMPPVNISYINILLRRRSVAMSITGNEVSDVKPRPIKTENTDNGDEKIESNSERQNER